MAPTREGFSPLASSVVLTLSPRWRWRRTAPPAALALL
jgi:hypothetical protein